MLLARPSPDDYQVASPEICRVPAGRAIQDVGALAHLVAQKNLSKQFLLDPGGGVIAGTVYVVSSCIETEIASAVLSPTLPVKIRILKRDSSASFPCQHVCSALKLSPCIVLFSSELEDHDHACKLSLHRLLLFG